MPLLTVVTYNVHACKGLEGRRSPERIARVLAQYDADVVALQELDMERPRSGYAHQPRVIAEELDMHWHFYSPPDWEDGHYGCAILSKRPMTLVKAGVLPRRRACEPRGVLWGALECAHGRVSIVNTHFGFRRREQTNQLHTLLSDEWLGSACADRPAICCGDFNFTPRSAFYRRMTREYRDVQTTAANDTYFRTWLGLRTLDYIFVTPDIRVQSVYVLRNRATRMASDHLPLMARLELPPALGLLPRG